jgi:hypothetical protein
MKPPLIAIGCFVLGVATSLLLFRAVQPENVSVSEFVRIEQRVIYTTSGKIEEAYFSYPTQEEFFKALSDASGYTIIAEDLPKTPYSYSAKVGLWEDIIRFSAPYGAEAIPEGEKTYRIRRIQK